MEWLLVLFIIVIVLFVLFKNKNAATSDYPYEQLESLLSPAERSFYGVLCQAVDGRLLVFGKVRVADILKVRKGINKSEWQKHFNRISSKHFDFVLCNADDLSVVAVVELDDSSHNSRKSKVRDEFIEKACESGELKLHRFRASYAYSIPELREALFPAPMVEPSLSEQRVDPILNDGIDSISVEKKETSTCPKCSAELVQKVANKGAQKGREFLACSAFPKCRYIAK